MASFLCCSRGLEKPSKKNIECDQPKCSTPCSLNLEFIVANRRRRGAYMNEHLPDNIGSPDKHEIYHDNIVLVGPSVEIVNGIFKDRTKMMDGKDHSKELKSQAEDDNNEQKIDAPSM